MLLSDFQGDGSLCKMRHRDSVILVVVLMAIWEGSFVLRRYRQWNSLSAVSCRERPSVMSLCQFMFRGEKSMTLVVSWFIQACRVSRSRASSGFWEIHSYFVITLNHVSRRPCASAASVLSLIHGFTFHVFVDFYF